MGRLGTSTGKCRTATYENLGTIPSIPAITLFLKKSKVEAEDSDPSPEQRKVGQVHGFSVFTRTLRLPNTIVTADASAAVACQAPTSKSLSSSLVQLYVKMCDG